MKTALVLSGGGARGAYQVGVYKALMKAKIEINIITGTSIGALNGCMFVQGDYKKAYKMWNNLSFKSVLEDAGEIDFKTFKGRNELFSKYVKALIKDGGFDISKIEKTVKESFNVYKFYYSNIDFGLVTVRFNDLKPIMLTKSDLNEETVVDYLVASATIFPAFQKKEIEEQIFIDGGYYDNLPIDLAIKMGAEKIIAVDLDAIGRKRNVETDLEITYIKPKSNLGSFLNFDKKTAKRAIDLGYNDAMKSLGYYEGEKFTFKKRHIYFNQLAYEENFKNNLNKFATFKTRVGNKIKESIYLGYIEGDYSEFVIEILDYLGTVFNLDETEVYGVFKFNNKIRNRFSKLHRVDSKRVSQIFKNKTINNLMDKKALLKYIYSQLENQNIEKLNVAAAIFPKEYIASVYLYTIYN